MRTILLTLFCAVAVPLAASAKTPSSDALCKRAISEKRANGMSMKQCGCLAGVAKKNLDPRVYALWAEAMYTGKSQQKKVQRLGISQANLVKQFQAVAKGGQRSCGIKTG